jgi:hypothetical protein
VFRQVIEVEAGKPRGMFRVLPIPMRASRLRIEAVAPTGEPVRLAIGDVRVQGQTRALAEYIGRTLRFPAP